MSLTRNQTRRVYSFKSSGVKRDDASRTNNANDVKPPIGIKTPIQFAYGNGLFEMHTSLDKQIADNLRNLLLTNHGERLGQYDFGANLRPLLFDLSSEKGDQEAISRIRAAVTKYMPYIALQNFQVFVDNNDNEAVGKIGLMITYTIPRLNEAVRSIELMLYMGG